MTDTGARDGGTAIEMVAFVVEGFGAFLVPMAVLAPYRVDENPFDDDDAGNEAVGWGWQLPTVRWNAFDIAQANRPITLAPGLVTRLDPALFLGGDDPWGASPSPLGPDGH